MRHFIFLSPLFLFSQTLFAAIETNTAVAARTVDSSDIMRWLGALLIVLCLFFICVWLVRKASLFNLTSNNQMRVVGGLSIGAKERIVLVQLGDKQLVLGVCPGRVETLHILEGDDCLVANKENKQEGFAKKLNDAIIGQASE